MQITNEQMSATTKEQISAAEKKNLLPMHSSNTDLGPKNTALFETENANQNHNVKLNHKAQNF